MNGFRNFSETNLKCRNFIWQWWGKIDFPYFLVISEPVRWEQNVKNDIWLYDGGLYVLCMMQDIAQKILMLFFDHLFSIIYKISHI